MASDLVLSLSIGASVSGAFNTAFANASSTVNQLGDQTSKLTAKQERLGGILSAGMARPHASMTKLHNQYVKVGHAIEHNRKAQERLNKSIARSDRLTNQRADLRASAMETIGTGTAFAAPFIAGAKAAIDFESSMAEVNKTVGFDGKESLNAFGNEIKEMSKTIPVSPEGLASIAAAGGQLGVAKEKLVGFTSEIAQMSVAFDMAPEQAGDQMAGLVNSLGEPISSIGQLGDAINAVSNSSPAKANAIVTAMQRVGATAKQAGLVKEQTVALTGTMIALGKSPEVASTAINGMLGKLQMFDPNNKKQAGVFKQMGLDVAEFKNLMATDGQGAINLFLSKVNELPQNERLGAMVNFFGAEYGDDVLSLATGIDTYTANLKTLQAVDKNGNPQYIGSMSREFQSISSTTDNKIQLFKNNLNLLAINIGDALIPAINDAIITVKPFIEKISKFAQENPKVVKSMALLVAGLFAGKLGFIGARYGLNLLMAGANGVMLPIHLLTGKWSLFKGLLALGIKPKGLIKLGGGLLKLGRVMRVVGLMFMTNPILLAVVAIAGAAFLIYRNWDKIKPYFSGLWTKLKAFANSGVGNILKTIASFSPIGLFIRAWSFVFSYFAGLVPKFRGFGSNIIQGLISGITAKFGALKSKISNLASSTAGWFKSKLGIQSPSRVFMGFGANIAEGVAIGIGQQTPTAVKASDEMAKRLAQTQYSNQVLGSQSISGGMSAGTIHFSPNINVTVGADTGDVSSQVQQGLSASFEQFERMLEQVEYNRQRRAFA